MKIKVKKVKKQQLKESKNDLKRREFETKLAELILKSVPKGDITDKVLEDW